ncbi:hypothetical protein [Rhizobium oryziradicis]|uniref:Uncharacterized protein n=1 Tax=Rhizobium oryziradicis TaxID=1867956 RepID=A0A1Q8ZUF5_9HYPH|nr:hypothetical protein [Rhizobium oryziradicis]OLP45693.1 hypothetical protein BJF95_11165 [Rhizobium oryziradicis]
MPMFAPRCIDKNQIAIGGQRKLEFFVMMSHTGMIAPHVRNCGPLWREIRLSRDVGVVFIENAVRE